MAAAHLASLVAASALPQEERVRLMAAVVPVASQDVTRLDQVFGPPLCLSKDLGADGPAVETLLHRQVTREPTGVWAGTA